MPSGSFNKKLTYIQSPEVRLMYLLINEHLRPPDISWILHHKDFIAQSLFGRGRLACWKEVIEALLQFIALPLLFRRSTSTGQMINKRSFSLLEPLPRYDDATVVVVGKEASRDKCTIITDN